MSGLGGTENATFRLGRLLRQRGHEVVLASSDGPLIKEAQALGIQWRPIDFYQGGILGYIKGMFAYMKMLKQDNPDIIHCHGTFTALGMLYLKKYYHDDPCLKKAKIIYSLYDEPAPVEIPDTLFECLKFDKIKPAALSVLDGKTDYEALNRLAIHYANGVVQGSAEISPSLKQYIDESGVNFLPYTPVEGCAEVYNEFYKKILP